MTMTRRAQRWKTCLHESAHCVVSRALNSWDCTARATVREDGNAGAASFPWGLTAFDYAVSTAAGGHGETLPFPPPARRCRPPLPPAETAAGIRARAVRATEAEIADKSHRRAMAAGTDPESVAAYCVSLHPAEPQEWVAAHDRVHDEARRAVWEHRDTIRAVAVRLFHAGRVELPGDPEHEAYFQNGGAVAVDQ
jgi:hypothetical protein